MSKADTRSCTFKVEVRDLRVFIRINREKKAWFISIASLNIAEAVNELLNSCMEI